MTHWIPIGLGLLLASAGLASAASESSREELEKWVWEMADPDYATREQATRELWMAGSAALQVLNPAAEDRQNPERMLRALEVIRKIRLGLTPDSDSKVIAWAKEYETADLKGKLRILGLLKGRRAWFPMLRLYAEESHDEDAGKLAPALEGVALRAARESIAAGKMDRAFTALRLAPKDQSSWIAEAVLLRALGKLDLECKPWTQAQKKSARSLAFLRAKGDVCEARRVASLLEDSVLSAWLAVFDGDPLPWIRTMNPAADAQESRYVRLAMEKWSGETMSAALLDDLIKRADGGRRDSGFSAVNLLFLLARPDLAERALPDHSPLASFLYHDSMERIGDALRSLGLDPRKPDFRTWFVDALARYRKLDVDNQHSVSDVESEIIALAAFLEHRGLGQTLDQALTGPMLDYANDEPFEFTDLLSRLFGSPQGNEGAPDFAARMAIAWAGDDPGRWEEVVSHLLGETEVAFSWWGALSNDEPAMSRPERLAVMMALFQIGSDRDRLRARWMPRLLERSQNSVKWVGLLHQLAIQTGDANLYGALIDRLKPVDREGVHWGMRMHFLSALGRWDDVVALLRAHMMRHEEGGRGYVPEIHLYAYLASALRKTGKADEARKYDRLAEILYLGEGGFAYRIAEGYAYCGDNERAYRWLRRACIENDIWEPGITGAMNSLATASMARGDWLSAASISEGLLRIYASPNLQPDSPSAFAQLRLQADTARALSRLSEDRPAAIRALGESHQFFLTHGALADVFFPSLRKAGLIAEHDRWFDETWNEMNRVIALYPDSDNTRNTIAWLASRAIRRLDEGRIHIRSALGHRPNQAAYLDTMAELEFASGDRRQAIHWSTKAMCSAPEDSAIRRQNWRFRDAPLPNP